MLGHVCSKELAAEDMLPIPCSLDRVDDDQASESRGLQKAASNDSLQFLIPPQHDSTSVTDDESYSVPLSMRRPRSDSGSRYLTNSVCRLPDFCILLDQNKSYTAVDMEN